MERAAELADLGEEYLSPGVAREIVQCVPALVLVLTREGLVEYINPFFEEVSGYVASQRERIHATLSELVPFLSDHAELIDSPHDGRDAQNLSTGALIAPEEPWSRGPRTMRAVHGYPVRGMLGVAGLPLRTPLRRLLLCGPHNLPGLGLEGSLVAAWSAARVVTRNDRRREWMRRGLWTRMEI